MKKIIIVIGILVGILGMLIAYSAKRQHQVILKSIKGKSNTLQTMRKDLAEVHQVEYTCPVTTGILLRIVSKAAHEQLQGGKKLTSLTPFRRIVDDNSSLAKKLSFGTDFIKAQGIKEGIAMPQRKRTK